ncbi:MAG: ABC transporter substrate-binding protein [Desulfobaccales bacterium]
MAERQGWSPLAGLAVLVFGLLLGSGGCQNLFSRPPLVGIITWSQGIKDIDDNLQGIVEGLREEGYLDGLNLRLQILNAREDRSLAVEAAEKLQRQGAKLLITVGTVTTMVALEVTEESCLPVVYSAVGAPQATGVEWQAKAPARVTGTSSEVPAAQQLEMFRLACPGVKNVGLLYCTATPVAVATGAASEEAARDLGFKVIKATVTDERPELLDQALTQLLNRGVQGLFLPPDPVLASPKNLQIVCTRMLEARVPVMVPFGSEVVYGALLSYHADLGEAGRQTGRQAARILSGASPAQVPPKISKDRRLTVNLNVAQSLGIHLSRHLLSRTHKLY